MKKGDLIIIALVLIVVSLSFISLLPQGKPTEGADLFVDVTISGNRVYTGPLTSGDSPNYVRIELSEIRPDHPDPAATLEIQDGTVRVMPMPLELCPEKICHTVMGRIRRPGQMIVCMPNEMVIQIKTEQQDELDYDILAG